MANLTWRHNVEHELLLLSEAVHGALGDPDILILTAFPMPRNIHQSNRGLVGHGAAPHLEVGVHRFVEVDVDLRAEVDVVLGVGVDDDLRAGGEVDLRQDADVHLDLRLVLWRCP